MTRILKVITRLGFLPKQTCDWQALPKSPGRMLAETGLGDKRRETEGAGSSYERLSGGRKGD